MNQPLPNNELLTAYLDNELSPEDRARVEQRLTTDAEYAATLGAFQDVQKRLQSLPKGSIDVRRSVMKRVGEQSRVAVRERQSNWQAAAWAIASLAALLLLGLFLFLPETELAVVQKDAAEVGDAVARKDGDEVALDKDDAPFKLQEGPPQSEALAAIPESQSHLRRSVAADRLESSGLASGQATRGMQPSPQSVAREPALPAAVSQPMERADRSREASEAQLINESILRRESAPELARKVPVFSTPLQSSSSASSLDKKLLEEEADSDQLDDIEERHSAQVALDDLTIDPAAAGVDALTRNVFRVWHVRPKHDQSGERLTLARFRRALEQAGCDYREAEPLRPRRQSSALKKGAEAGDVAKEKREINFIVVATPEQLVTLRNLTERFASVDRIVEIMSSIRVLNQPQKEWDGSRLPRVNGLDPAGDGRTYRFLVFLPEKEKEPSGDR